MAQAFLLIAAPQIIYDILIYLYVILIPDTRQMCLLKKVKNPKRLWDNLHA